MAQEKHVRTKYSQIKLLKGEQSDKGLFICFLVNPLPHNLFAFWLTHYLIETRFNTFANRADTDQAALVRAA